MRRLLAVLLILALPLTAADVNGKWKGTIVTTGHTLAILLFLRQEGTTLKGSGGPDGLNQSPLENGKVVGARLTFDIRPPGHLPLHFELTADGDKLNGTATVKPNGQVTTNTVSLY